MGDLGNALAGLTAVLAFAVLLATINERLIEQFVGPALNRVGAGDWTGQVALFTGMALAFGIDLFTPAAEALGMTLNAPWAGMALTGLLIGGGSNFIHDVWPTSAPDAIVGEILEITTADGETIQVQAALEPTKGS